MSSDQLGDMTHDVGVPPGVFEGAGEKPLLVGERALLGRAQREIPHALATQAPQRIFERPNRTQGIEARVQTGLHTASNGDSPFSNLTHESKGEFLHALTYPTLLGDSSIMFKGLESAVVRDYSSEIAKKATLAHPIIQTTFCGIVAALHPSPRGQGVGAEFRSTVTNISLLSRQASTEPSVGELQHIQVDHVARSSLRCTPIQMVHFSKTNRSHVKLCGK